MTDSVKIHDKEPTVRRVYSTNSFHICLLQLLDHGPIEIKETKIENRFEGSKTQTDLGGRYHCLPSPSA